MYEKEAIEKLIAEVLDGTELKLKVDSYALEENLENRQVTIRCDVHHQRTGKKKTIHGTGVGIVNAFFNGLVDIYSGEFPSLTTILFSEFSIRAQLETGRDSARTDSNATVTLRVTNSEGREFEFEDSSPSITRSSLRAVLMVAEFFINSERAFIEVYNALQHAREENRPDSIQRYTAQLTTLVGATSYSEVIEQIKEKELNNN